MPDADTPVADTPVGDAQLTDSQIAVVATVATVATKETMATDDDFERARAALLDITPAETIGAPAGQIDEGDGVVSVYFDVVLPGYPGWRWTATIAHVEGFEPSVLETEMTPGDGALLSPDWVPWVDRLADYHAAQEATDLAAARAAEGDDDDDDDAFDDPDDTDDEDDDIDDDDTDDEPIGRSLLHSGDLDGVDIDVLDESDELDVELIDEDSATAADAVEESEGSEDDSDDAGDEPVDRPSFDGRADQQ